MRLAPAVLVLLGATPLLAQQRGALTPSEHQVARLRETIRHGVGRLLEAEDVRAAGFQKRLARLDDRLEDEFAPSSEESAEELHVVGVGSAPGPSREQRVEAEVTVRVTYTDRPVVLALSAFGPCAWTIEAGEGVRISRILLGGFHRQRIVSGAVAPVTTRVQAEGASDYFIVDRRGDYKFERASKVLKRLSGLEVKTFQGTFRPGGPYVVGPESHAWRADYLASEYLALATEILDIDRAALRQSLAGEPFTILDRSGRSLVTRTLAGSRTAVALPQVLKSVAIDPRGGCFGLLDKGGLAAIDTSAGSVAPVKTIDAVSYVMAITWDARRKALVVATATSVYAYRPATEKWTHLFDHSHMVSALVHDPERRRFYVLEEVLHGEGERLVVLDDRSGAVIETHDLAGAASGSGFHIRADLAWVGRKLLYRLIGGSGRGEGVVVDPDSGDALDSVPLD